MTQCLRNILYRPKILPIQVFSALILLYAVSCNSKESVDKQRVICTVLPSTYHSLERFKNRLIADTSFFWLKDTLPVFFFDGSTNFQTYIIKKANDWYPYSGIKFVRVSDKRRSLIRISFERDSGFNSALGTEALWYSVNDVTMHLHKLYTYDSTTIRNTVLHEFGHALGVMHELQSMNVNIPWDTAAVYDYYKKEFKWNRDSVDKYVFTKINYGVASYFDSLSVMAYAVPNSLTIGDYEIVWNEKLSEADKYFIKKWYDEKREN